MNDSKPGAVGTGADERFDAFRKELARRICAAYTSLWMHESITTWYRKTPEDVGSVWYLLADLTVELAQNGQDASMAEVLRRFRAIEIPDPPDGQKVV